MFLPKHTKVISLVRADDLRNINCRASLRMPVRAVCE